MRLQLLCRRLNVLAGGCKQIVQQQGSCQTELAMVARLLGGPLRASVQPTTHMSSDIAFWL